MGSGDLSELLENPWIFRSSLSSPGEVGESFVVPTSRNEPSRGFLDEREQEDHETGGDDLESDGDSPRSRAAFHGGYGDSV